jgi:hypothetical protein
MCALSTLDQGGTFKATTGPLDAAVQHGMGASGNVDQLAAGSDTNIDQESNAASLPRWLVMTLNCVVVGGVAATVSVALIGIRRSSSFGSRQSLANDMAGILERAGRRRGWTEARTARVLHLIGVNKDSLPEFIAEPAAPNKVSQVVVTLGRPVTSDPSDERHTYNAVARPRLQQPVTFTQPARACSSRGYNDSGPRPVLHVEAPSACDRDARSSTPVNAAR